MNKISYKNWAFRLAIWLLITTAAIYYLTVSYVKVGQEDTGPTNLFYLAIIATILFISSLIFLVLGTLKKETRDFKYWFSLIVVILILAFGIYSKLTI